MIKAILFDYFGVISSDDYWKFVRHHRDRANIFRTYANEVNTGEMHWPDFIKKVAKATGTDISKVNELYKSERIDPRVIALINDLHGKYKTGLITNANNEFIDEILRKNNMYDIFDCVTVSSTLGYSKPDPRIFEHALAQLKIRPNEAIYIDDLARHVDAASSLGMQAIVYKNFDQAKSELDAILAQA